MSKKVTLIMPGAGEDREARDAPIEPGTTAADLLKAANLDPEQWLLQLRRGDGFISLSGGDVLWDRVQEGEKVFPAAKNMTVG